MPKKQSRAPSCNGTLCGYRDGTLPYKLDENGILDIDESTDDDNVNYKDVHNDALKKFRNQSCFFCEKCISNYVFLITEHDKKTAENKTQKSIRKAEHIAALATLKVVGDVDAFLNWSFSKCIESYHKQNKNYSDTGEIIYGKKKLFKKKFKIQFTEILLQTKQVVYLMMLELLVLFTDGDYYSGKQKSGTPKNGRELKLFIKNSNLPENIIVNFNHVIGAFNSLLNQFNKTAMREYKRIWITNATVCKKINDVDIVIPLPLTMDICMKIYLFLQRHR